MAQWQNLVSPPEDYAYTCGYCGNTGGPRGVYKSNVANTWVLICSVCSAPTALWHGELVPAVRFGGEVAGLPSDVGLLYEEARGCMSVPAYTAAILLCRKILMHVAVESGADVGLKFVQYVEYLWEQHYVPPNAKGWVDHIREKGNEATHEIVQMGREEAEQLISFTEILLKLVYELPQRVPGASAPSA